MGHRALWVAGGVPAGFVLCLAFAPWAVWPAPEGVVLQWERARVLDRRHDVASVCHGLGTARLKQQRYAAAEDAYVAALELEPGRRDTMLSLVMLHLARGDASKAGRALFRLQDADPPPWRLMDTPPTREERRRMLEQFGHDDCRICLWTTGGPCSAVCFGQ